MQLAASNLDCIYQRSLHIGTFEMEAIEVRFVRIKTISFLFISLFFRPLPFYISFFLLFFLTGF